MRRSGTSQIIATRTYSPHGDPRSTKASGMAASVERRRKLALEVAAEAAGQRRVGPVLGDERGLQDLVGHGRP